MQKKNLSFQLELKNINPICWETTAQTDIMNHMHQIVTSVPCI